MPSSGGCLCGKVTYEVRGDPVSNFLCHCKNCQKQSGSAFSINLIYPKSQFKQVGTLSTFVDKSKNGDPLFRQFCPNCGTPIMTTLPHLPDLIVLKVGTLDDSSIYTPAAEVWCDSRQNWVDFEDDYPKFAENPPL